MLFVMQNSVFVSVVVRYLVSLVKKRSLGSLCEPELLLMDEFHHFISSSFFNVFFVYLATVLYLLYLYLVKHHATAKQAELCADTCHCLTVLLVYLPSTLPTFLQYVEKNGASYDRV